MIDRLLLRNMIAYRRHWSWVNMQGSAACLKWGLKDLRGLDEALHLVPGRDTVVQAGGNLGLFPKRLSEEFRRVITFEPDPNLFRMLKHNARETNIEAHQAALGNSFTPVSVSSHRRDSSGRPEHEGLTHVSGPGDIPQTKIDELGLTKCDLIYLDVEGYEWEILKGSVQTIATCRPVLVVEINKNCSFAGFNKEDFRDWILNLGYRFVKRVNSDDVFIPF